MKREVPMPLKRLTRYLDEKGVSYRIQKHATAFTSMEVAASTHIPGRKVAKTVIMMIDDEMKMVVLPSTHKIDFEQIREALHAGYVRLATEVEFESRFPDCELGAMPPFGNLYDMETIVSESLTEEDEIAFDAGTHNEVIILAFRDYEELVSPRILPVAVKEM
jgi:Ala-tRNA(Pro) deacylase